MIEELKIDKLDREILQLLEEDGKIPYTEIAKKLIVSHGTVHLRINKLESMGIIKGTGLRIDYQKLGFDVTTLLGIHLKSAKDQTKVVEKLRQIKEVVEVYYTTGAYALIIKVHNKNIKDFHHFLVEKLQSISEIQSTESFICLDNPISRPLKF